MEQQIFYKIDLLRCISKHECEIRTIYCDDYDVVHNEQGQTFYVCRFSNGQQLTLLADLFDDYHVIALNRQEKSPE